MSHPRTGSAPPTCTSIRRVEGPARVRRALRHVRRANSADGALQLGLLEVCATLGFRRAALTRIAGEHLVAEHVHVPNAPRLAARVLDQLSVQRTSLADLPDEAAAALTGDAVLVATPQASRLPSEITAIVGRGPYVAAPIVLGDVTVGFVHADDSDSPYPLSGHDRDCLWAFTEGLSCVVAWRRALERTLRDGLATHAPSP